MKARFIFILIGATLLPLSPLCRAALAAEPDVIDGIAAVVGGQVSAARGIASVAAMELYRVE